MWLSKWLVDVHVSIGHQYVDLTRQRRIMLTEYEWFDIVCPNHGMQT